MNRDLYEEGLRQRQEQHLKNIENNQSFNWKPCRHDGCTECVGTGIKSNGQVCVHMLYCDCPKCSPTYLAMPADSTA